MAPLEVVTVRLSAKDVERLVALTRRFPGATRAALARDLLRSAIDATEKNPASLVRAPAEFEAGDVIKALGRAR